MTPEEEEDVEVTTEQLRRSVKYALETTKFEYGTHWCFNGDSAQETVPSVSAGKRSCDEQRVSDRESSGSAPTFKRQKKNYEDEGVHAGINTGRLVRLDRIDGPGDLQENGSSAHFDKEKQVESEQDKVCNIRDIFDTDTDEDNDEVEFNENRAAKSDWIEDNIEENTDEEKHNIDEQWNSDRESSGSAPTFKRQKKNCVDEGEHGGINTGRLVRLERIDGPGDLQENGSSAHFDKEKPGGQVPNENRDRIQELGLKILVTHRGQYISEEDLYGLISEYGEVMLMTDAKGGDLEELPVFPSNIWIRYTKEELNNPSNPIFSLNKADLSIIHTSYQRIWTYNQELRCFKNISGEQWRRGRWDVVREADVEGLIEDGSKITVRLKTGKDWTGHYTRETYVAYTGTKSSCTAVGDSICMENALRTTTIIVPGRQEWFRAKLHSACVFLTSTSTIQLI